MEGLVIYASDNQSTITIFYLAALFKVKFEEISKFVIKKLSEVLSPKKVNIKVLHSMEDGKSRPMPMVKSILKKMGFKIKSIMFDKTRKRTYSIFQRVVPQEEYKFCRVVRPKARIMFSSEVILSNQVRLVQEVNKAIKRYFIDFRTMVFFAFLSYFNKGYESHRKKLMALNSFHHLLEHYERNMVKLDKIEVFFDFYLIERYHFGHGEVEFFG
jgi:hypothetical protein